MADTVTPPTARRTQSLPWWTWVAPALVCHLGTQASIQFQFAPGVSILYLPIPLAMAMIQWWGPRVLPGMYLNAALCAGWWGLPRAAYWPLYAIPETLAVGVTWLLFTMAAGGRHGFPALRDVVAYILLAIVPAACIDGFMVPGNLVLLGDLAPEAFWPMAWSEWMATLLGGFGVAMPLLCLGTPLLERRGWSRKAGAEWTGLVPPERFQIWTPLEIGAVGLAAALLSLAEPVSSSWFLYAVLALWAGLRFGLPMASLANAWILLFTLIVPAALSGQYGASWTGETALIRLHIGLGMICAVSTLTGAMTSALHQELRHRTRAERALRESRARLQLLMDHSPMAITWADAAGAIQYCNRKFEGLFGYGPADIPTIDAWFERAYPDPGYRERIGAAWRRAIAEAAARDGMVGPLEDVRIACKDGGERIAEVSGLHLPDQLMAVFNDTTERRRAEQALRESEFLFRSQFDHGNIGIAISGLDKKWLRVNPKLCAMLGYSREELLLRTWSEVTHPEDLASDVGEFDRMLRGEIDAYELNKRFVRSDGGIVHTRLAVSCHRDPTRGVEIIIASFMDVTESVRLEEQLRHAQKMEAVGQLAGGVAHDFNNLLQAILGYGEMAQMQVAPGGPVDTDLREMLGAARRAKALVQQLLAFSRRQVLTLENLALDTVVNDLAKMVERLIGASMTLAIESATGLWSVRADRGQIEQVLINLCVNARDAMPDGGCITIRVCNVEESPEAGEGPAKRHVEITVSDTGVGIDGPTLAHIFEPFFTTKDTGKGTGLGLATVYGIVRQHEGSIRVTSEVGRGTAFVVRLPALNEPAAPLSEPENETAPSGTETLLVAEDDPGVRTLTERILRGAGYTVIAAKDGAEAIALFDAHADRIDMALLDAVMPRAGGRAVLDHIRRERPGIRVLFASGYSGDTGQTNFIVDAGVRLVQKPYRRDALLRAIREVLDT